MIHIYFLILIYFSILISYHCWTTLLVISSNERDSKMSLFKFTASKLSIDTIKRFLNPVFINVGIWIFGSKYSFWLLRLHQYYIFQAHYWTLRVETTTFLVEIVHKDKNKSFSNATLRRARAHVLSPLCHISFSVRVPYLFRPLKCILK